MRNERELLFQGFAVAKNFGVYVTDDTKKVHYYWSSCWREYKQNIKKNTYNGTLIRQYINSSEG
jgi:hypothetical protein